MLTLFIIISCLEFFVIFFLVRGCFVDSLTTCYNRNYYNKVVKILYQYKWCYVTMIDVDNLKFINDTEGHSSGNILLRKVGSSLRDSNRKSKVLRVGGDEFVIISKVLPSFPSVENLVSYGTYYKEPYEDLSSALRKADILMYHQKLSKHTERLS